MIAYKGFAPGLICRGYQFVMGLNVTDKANCTANGFHCAENPLDCLTYYPNMEQSEYYLVDAGGDVDEDAVDSKIACTELTIRKKLSREEFFLHALAYMYDHPSRKCSRHVRRDQGMAEANGYVVVRGADPVAMGKRNSILALAKEGPGPHRIEQVTLICVDGKRAKPNVWYDADLKERAVENHD
jgi:hypothetical protein